MKNSGNETFEPPFRGTIVITQNAQVSAGDAILQRIVHLNFDRKGHTPETKHLAEQLERMPMESISYFLHLVLTQDEKILDIFERRIRTYEQRLMDQP